MKRILVFVCIFSLVLGLAGCSSGSVTVVGSDGEVISTQKKLNFSSDELENKGYESYVKLALNEAVEILREVYDCTQKEAEKKLFKGEFTVKTAFDKTAYLAIENMYAKYQNEEKALSVGAAITDYNGNVKAVFSGGEELYGIEPHAPFSTIKPLSVYAQAMDSQLIDWSTKMTDKPYKKVAGENGREKDWPTNASGGYTYKQTNLQDCIKTSLNTTAVYTLNRLGVDKSIKFMSEKFGADLGYEQNKIILEGADETIGNVALGYLYKGFTPVELAGYYQVFGNLGKYTKPHTVTEICDKKGNTVYSSSDKSQQIFSEETAYIMNKLLESVVSPSGTGSEASLKGAALVGKTGTGTEEGNWFVGVTPEYCCSVWHGDNNDKNIADRMFTEIFATMPEHTKTEFPELASVRKVICCSESGLKFSGNCNNMHIGYFAADRQPSVCDKH